MSISGARNSSGGGDVHAVALQGRSQVASVMREEVVGVGGHRKGTNVDVGWVDGQLLKVGGGGLVEVSPSGGEVLRQVVDPALRRGGRELLLRFKRSARLGEELFAPEQVEHAQVARGATHQVVQYAREDDVGVENRAGPAAAAHSGGAPIASSSRDHSSASSRP